MTVINFLRGQKEFHTLWGSGKSGESSLPLKMKKMKGIQRTEKKNYPKIALREGILNAIVHRDYKSIKGFLQLSICLLWPFTS